jgi:hypothetical protein
MILWVKYCNHLNVAVYVYVYISMIIYINIKYVYVPAFPPGPVPDWGKGMNNTLNRAAICILHMAVEKHSDCCVTASS